MLIVNYKNYFVESFIKALATLFNSTKANGKIPILSNSFPSAQFSSTLLITLIISPYKIIFKNAILNQINKYKTLYLYIYIYLIECQTAIFIIIGHSKII